MRIVGIIASAGTMFPELEVEKAIALFTLFSRYSVLSFKGELTYPAYKYIPASYILCENNFNIKLDTRRQYVDRIETQSGNDI